MAADEKDSSVGKDIKRLAIESLMRCLKSWPHSNSSENVSCDCKQPLRDWLFYLSGNTDHISDNISNDQLFLSLALADALWLVWYRNVVDEPLIVRSNPPWCVFLHLALHYFMIANYFWMFCEGLHLHLALVVVFVHDKIAMRWFLALGWGGPALLIGIYGTTRLLHGDDSRSCWMDDSMTMWILTVPVLISLVASMVFLGNVVRVLLTKLHSGSAHPVPQSLRKGVRATLILVPLFGLQHILLPFRPDAGTTGEKIYQIVSVLFVSLQGICVSCLFCFANQDVLIAMRSVMANLCPYARYGGRSDSINMAPGMTTQSRDVNA